MGAAWKSLKDGNDLEAVVEMIKQVKALGLEACVTLGSITKAQAEKLKEAGLDAYNHNIDTSPDFIKEIISTRKFEQRLETIKNVESRYKCMLRRYYWYGERLGTIELECSKFYANLTPQPEECSY